MRPFSTISSDCRLDPRVVVAAPGDVIVLENEMFYPFLPTTNSTAFLRGLIKDQPQEVPVERVGLMPITCGMMAGCGRTDVVIAATRLSTVTGEDGAFVLENVPAGLALHVHAWHPLLQEGVVDVTLEAGSETPVEVSVSSRAAPAPRSGPAFVVSEIAPGGCRRSRRSGAAAHRRRRCPAPGSR